MVLGVAVGEGVAVCVGGSGVWRKPAPVPPTFLQTHPFLVPSGKHQLTHLPQVQCPEKRGVQGELSPASLLLLVRLGLNEEGGLPQPPTVRVRAATSGLMSQQAFSQILSLFSFLLHEMGIINEKQRGAGRGSGGTLLLACQTCAPTPKLEP